MLEPQYDIDASPGVVLKSCTGPAHPISNRGAHAAAQTVPTLKVEITTVAEGESGANRGALGTTTIAFAPNETTKTVLFVRIDDGMSEPTEVFGSIVGSLSVSEATVEPSTPAYVTELGNPYRFVLIQDNDNRFRLALTFENPEADLTPFAASESRGRRLIGCLWQRQVLPGWVREMTLGLGVGRRLTREGRAMSPSRQQMANVPLRLAGAMIVLWVGLSPQAPGADAQGPIDLEFDRSPTTTVTKTWSTETTMCKRARRCGPSSRSVGRRVRKQLSRSWLKPVPPPTKPVPPSRVWSSPLAYTQSSFRRAPSDTRSRFPSLGMRRSKTMRTSPSRCERVRAATDRAATN